MTGSGSSTCRTELPVTAHSVTQRTHGDIVLWVADLHAREKVTEKVLISYNEMQYVYSIVSRWRQDGQCVTANGGIKEKMVRYKS